MTKLFLVEESATGDLYIVCAKDVEAVCTAIGVKVQGLEPPIAAGNVDVNPVEVPKMKAGQVFKWTPAKSKLVEVKP